MYSSLTTLENDIVVAKPNILMCSFVFDERMWIMKKVSLLFLAFIICGFGMTFSDEIRNPASLTLTGDWTVKVEYDGQVAELTVPKPELIHVKFEKYDSLPVYNANGPIWHRGTKLHRVHSSESPGFSIAGIVDNDSIIIRSGTGDDAIVYEKGKDYDFEPLWVSLGRLPEGRIGENQPVFIDYVYGPMRLDSIVLTQDKRITLKKGKSHNIHPMPPQLSDDEVRLANIWVYCRLEKLEPKYLFPILETAFPESLKISPGMAEKRLPKTMKKLRNNETLHILAWGDSVTDGGYLPDVKNHQWQEQFVKRLRERYPNAKIELTTEAWGGYNSDSYRNEPPGSTKNYKEKVLDRKADLIISEFVNDAWMDVPTVQEKYGKILTEFKEIDAEWIILTPHYVRTDWMGLDREKDIDDDPRPYTQGIKEFCEKNNVAIADAAARYGRLWRQGIPYSTLMMNNINHPNPDGMKIFADALMDLFAE